MRRAKGPWVLVTDDRRAQARAALMTVRALAAAGYRPAVTVATSNSLAAASRWCARRVPVALETVGTPDFKHVIEAELDRGDYLTVLPTGDAALLALGMPVEKFVDKTSLAQLAAEVGIESPPSARFESIDELRDGLEGLDYPVVVKPVTTAGAMRRLVSVQRLDRPSDLNVDGGDAGAYLVQPYLRDTLFSMAGVVWEGRLLAAAHQSYLRTWPRSCGGASAAVTTPPRADLERRVMGLLEGYSGVFQAQFSGPYLLDLNPRVYGSLGLSVRAGANLAGIYCDAVRGIQPPATVRARPAVHYRWVEGDLRHVVAGLRAGDTGVSDAFRILRPRRRTAHPESIGDPGPMLARARHVLRGRSAPEDSTAKEMPFPVE